MNAELSLTQACLSNIHSIIENETRKGVAKGHNLSTSSEISNVPLSYIF
jgi:hypothetical protein